MCIRDSGNTYISYADIEPFNTLLAATADVVQNAAVLGEEYTEKWLQKLTFMAASVIVDKSMLSGVDDLAAVMNADTSSERLTRVGARYVRSHLPYAGLLGQVGDLIDANRREADTLTEHLIRRDALLKATLPPQYDYLSKDRTGKPLSYAADSPLVRLINMVLPFSIYNAEGDPVKETLVEMRYNIPQVMSTYKGEPLNAFERSELQKYMAKGNIRRDLEKLILRDPKFRKDLEQYKKGSGPFQPFSSEAGEALYSQQFYLSVQKIFTDAKNEAMVEVLRNNPDLRRRVEIREAKKAASRSGSIDRLTELKREATKHGY